MINKVRLVVGDDSFKVIDPETERCIFVISRDMDSFSAVEYILKALGIKVEIE